MRKSEQESETAEQYEVRWRLDKDAHKEEGRGEVEAGVRTADGDGTVGLISSGGKPFILLRSQPCIQICIKSVAALVTATRSKPACAHSLATALSALSAHSQH